MIISNSLYILSGKLERGNEKMSKFCTNCGQQLNDIDKFCSSCGAKQVVESSNDDTSVSMQTIAIPMGTNTFNENKILEKELGKIGFKGSVTGGFIRAGLLGGIGAGFGGKIGASWAASKLKTDEIHDRISLSKNITESMTTVIQALSSMGTIIDASQYSDYPVISACCGSGYANMNPVVLCVEFIQNGNEKTDLHISGYAKEGLIKQKTAIKAIEKLKAMISK